MNLRTWNYFEWFLDGALQVVVVAQRVYLLGKKVKLLQEQWGRQELPSGTSSFIFDVMSTGPCCYGNCREDGHGQTTSSGLLHLIVALSYIEQTGRRSELSLSIVRLRPGQHQERLLIVAVATFSLALLI